MKAYKGIIIAIILFSIPFGASLAQINGAYVLPKSALPDFVPLQGGLYQGPGKDFPSDFAKLKGGDVLSKDFEPGYYAVYHVGFLTFFFGPYEHLIDCDLALKTLKKLREYPDLADHRDRIKLGIIHLHPEGRPLEFLKLPDGTFVLINLEKDFLNGSGVGQQGKGVVFNPLEELKIPIQAALPPKLNPIEDKNSLLVFAPMRQSQGRQGSCSAFAFVYAALTISFKIKYGYELVFSPAFQYNHTKARGDCDTAGTVSRRAIQFLEDSGAVPLSVFPYTEFSCDKKGTTQQYKIAQKYRIQSCQRLMEADGKHVNLNAIKQHINDSIPVVFSMMLPNSFHSLNGKLIWEPEPSEKVCEKCGHAMCVIGYDDNFTSVDGAFEVMNSWGEDFGIDGIIWIKYADFRKFVYGAYAPYIAGDSLTRASRISMEIVAQNMKSQPLVMEATNEVGFAAKATEIADKDIKITNISGCYLYIFAEDTNQNIIQVFPKKGVNESPYLGLSGSRLFGSELGLDKSVTHKVAIMASTKSIDIEKKIVDMNSITGDFGKKIDRSFGNWRKNKGELSKNKEMVSFSVSAESDAPTVLIFKVK